MADSEPVTVICTYRVAPDHIGSFQDLLKKHWPTLYDQGLVTASAPQLFRGAEGADAPFFVEIFEWRDESAPEIAHHTPAVLAVWERMGQLCQSRLGRPAMEFPHVKRLNPASR